MKRKSTMQGMSPSIDITSVLGMLEATQATGIFQARTSDDAETFYLRLFKGKLVKLINNRRTNEATSVMRMMASDSLGWTFRSVPGQPNGSSQLSVTGLMLEAAKLLDHARALERAA